MHNDKEKPARTSLPEKPQKTASAAPASPTEPSPAQPTQPEPPAAATPADNQSSNEFPPGWEPVSLESIGAWKGVGRIFVKPIGYTLSDSKRSLLRPDERVKPQAIIVCQVRSKNGISVQPFGQPKDAPPIVAKNGEYISIWYRPGLRDILVCAGIDVMLQDNGILKTERGEMNKFHVVKRIGQRGEVLQLLSDDKDFRVETRGMPLPWERQDRSDTNGDTEAVYAGGGKWAGDDDIPF